MVDLLDKIICFVKKSQKILSKTKAAALQQVTYNKNLKKLQQGTLAAREGSEWLTS
jgi:hypothetical protein